MNANPYMAAAGLPMSMIGAYLSNTDKARTQHNDPKWEGDYASVDALMRDLLLKRMHPQRNDPYWRAYETGGIRTINNTYNQAGATMENVLAARGLSRSPVAGSAMSGMNTSRASDIGSMQTQIPLLRRQQEAQDMAALMQYLAMTRSMETRYPGSAGGSALTAGGEYLGGGGAAGAFSFGG